MSDYVRRDTRAAEFAFRKIAALSADGSVSSAEYRSLVRGLPAMLATCRLPATVTFLLAKGKPHHNEAVKQLSEWIRQELEGVSDAPDPQYLVKVIRGRSSHELRRIERAAVRISVWLKQAAEALLDQTSIIVADTAEAELHGS